MRPIFGIGFTDIVQASPFFAFESLRIASLTLVLLRTEPFLDRSLRHDTSRRSHETLW